MISFLGLENSSPESSPEHLLSVDGNIELDDVWIKEAPNKRSRMGPNDRTVENVSDFQSIVQLVFWGKLRTTTKCNNCQVTSFRTELFSDFLLALPEKSRKVNNPGYNQTYIDPMMAFYEYNSTTASDATSVQELIQ